MTRAIDTASCAALVLSHGGGPGLGSDDPRPSTIRPHPEDFQGELIGVRAGVAKCLYCHITYPRAGRERIGPETADRAIGCERCHGPGGNHLAAVAAGFSDPAIVNPASASPRAVTEQQCNDCHILDRRYRHDDREKPDWVRSQGVGWIWSRCNTESGGAFGCVTCHDPHQGLRSTTTAKYEAKCLACHSATAAQPAGVPGPVGSGLDQAGTARLPRGSGERVHPMPHARRADGLIPPGPDRPLHPHPWEIYRRTGGLSWASCLLSIADSLSRNRWRRSEANGYTARFDCSSGSDFKRYSSSRPSAVRM